MAGMAWQAWQAMAWQAMAWQARRPLYSEVYAIHWSGPRPNGPLYVGQVIGLPTKPIRPPRASAP